MMQEKCIAWGYANFCVSHYDVMEIIEEKTFYNFSFYTPVHKLLKLWCRESPSF